MSQQPVTKRYHSDLEPLARAGDLARSLLTATGAAYRVSFHAPPPRTDLISFDPEHGRVFPDAKGAAQRNVEFVGALSLGDGLVLRRWLPEDAPSIAVACDDAEIARWLPVPSPYTVEDARSYLARVEAWWELGQAYALAISDGPSILGAISIRPNSDRPSIGYWLASSARGRGIVTRAVDTLVVWAAAAFRLSDVWIFAQPDNVASCRVARRAGFVEQDERVLFSDGKPRAVFRRQL